MVDRLPELQKLLAAPAPQTDHPQMGPEAAAKMAAAAEQLVLSGLTFEPLPPTLDDIAGVDDVAAAFGLVEHFVVYRLCLSKLDGLGAPRCFSVACHIPLPNDIVLTTLRRPASDQPQRSGALRLCRSGPARLLRPGGRIRKRCGRGWRSDCSANPR